MIDLNKNFEFTIKYVANEDKSWNVSYHTEEGLELTDDDIDKFMTNLLLIKQKRKIAEMTKDEQDKYNKLSRKEKLKYNLKFIFDKDKQYKLWGK